MKAGAVVATGSPREVITAELVELVFGMPCEVIDDPQTGTPLVVPASRVRRSAARAPAGRSASAAAGW